MKKHDYRAEQLIAELRDLRCGAHDKPIDGLRTMIFDNGSFEARWDSCCCADLSRRAGAIVRSQFGRCTRQPEVLRMRGGRTQIRLTGLSMSGERRDAPKDHEGLEAWQAEYTCASCGEKFVIDEMRAPTPNESARAEQS